MRVLSIFYKTMFYEIQIQDTTIPDCSAVENNVLEGTAIYICYYGYEP